MNIDDMILISVDDHVVEPPHMFEGRMPAALTDRAPRVVHDERTGSDVWVFNDEVIGNIGLVAVAGRRPEEYGVNPTSFDDMRAACFDIDERVKDMDASGILGSLCFPSFAQFCGQLFSRCLDRDLATATIQAYNNWHIDEWSGTHPGRMIPLSLIPLWDPVAAAAEVRRVAAKGCRAITFSENPAQLGLPSMHSPDWAPLWQACEEEEVVVCIHIGSSSTLPYTAPDAPVDVSFTITPVNLLTASADVVWSVGLQPFPGVKFALSEGGIGWIPYFLERADYVYKHHHAWTHSDLGGSLPSEVFRERMITCFISDRGGLEQRDKIGIDSICWECDYPHSDSTWPLAPEQLLAEAQGLSDAEINKISYLNAMRHFKFDPFKHIDRESARVGALRARVQGRDLTFSGRQGGDSNPAVGLPNARASWSTADMTD